MAWNALGLSYQVEGPYHRIRICFVLLCPMGSAVIVTFPGDRSVSQRTATRRSSQEDSGEASFALALPWFLKGLAGVFQLLHIVHHVTTDDYSIYDTH